MRENLMTVSPAGVAGAQSDIFSFDATEAAVAGICEMLLQSTISFGENGERQTTLHFLPALPSAWNSGSLRGLCARGGIEADFTWRSDRVVKATLRTKTPQTVIVLINGQTKQLRLQSGKTYSLI